MAKRKNKTRRRRFTGINATTALEAYLQTSVLTDMAFKATPVEFIFGNPGPSGNLTGANKVSLKELIDGFMAGGPIQGHAKTEFQYVVDNIMGGWLEAAIKATTIGVGFNVGTKLLRRPRAKANKLLRDVGLGQTVRV